MRKSLLWLLVLLMALSSTAGIAEELVSFGDDPVGFDETGELVEIVEPEGIQPGTHLTVGSLTAMSGYFSTDMWGNNTSDMDVRALLHGYETVAYTSEQGLAINPSVVVDLQVDATDPEGPVYILQIAQDLTYNDGTPITARDYVFSMLLGGAPEIDALGGTPQALSHVQGYEAYLAGETKVLSGVRLLSDYSFSILIKPEYLPYFYGLAMISAKPLPISEIAPGCEVRDDGEGVYIGSADTAASIDAAGLPYTPGEFSYAMLEKTLLDPETGYLSHPHITSGPYSLESYDAEENVATFVVNERFKGNYTGQMPHIERLTFLQVQEDTMLDQLASGEIDLLNKITDPQVMNQVQALIAQQGGLRQASYLRTGFAYLAFACEQPVTSSVAVRQAIARAFDKDALVTEGLGGSALRAYGYYGLGQWMATYTDEGDAAAGIEPINVQELLEVYDTPQDVEAARALLAADGWVYDTDGNPYVQGEGTVRYREADGQLEPLTIKLAVTEKNTMAGHVKKALEEALPALGVGLEVTELPFETLLMHYYRQTERTYDMFFMASNFTYIFDPYYDFNTAEAYQGMINTSGLRDELLMERAREMRDTEPMDLRSYVEKWLLFQERFVEMMPMVPLYSNVYFDIYTDALEGYDIVGNSGWSYSILNAFIVE